jgi:hypothetical protein
MTTRAVVHAVGDDPEPVETVTGRLRSGGIEILDRQPHMLLVAGSQDAVSSALGDARGWSVSEVTTVPHPKTRPTVLKKP